MTDLKSWSSPRTHEAFLLSSSTSFRQNVVLKIKHNKISWEEIESYIITSTQPATARLVWAGSWRCWACGQP